MGVMICLLYISAQMSNPPSMARFLSQYECKLEKAKLYGLPCDRVAYNYIPESTTGFDNNIIHIVGKSRNENTDDIFALQESSCRGIIMNQITDSGTCPSTLCWVCSLELSVGWKETT